MRYIIVSDTHGRREPIEKLYKQYPNDGIIHLGDYISDARWMLERTQGHPVYAVKGNCDPYEHGPEELLLELCGKKVLLCHGHRYGVKSGIGQLLVYAKARGVDGVFFGHTHTPLLEQREGMLVMNPGSLKMGDYGIIEIEEGKLKGVLLNQYE